jgi:hypothetical protein
MSAGASLELEIKKFVTTAAKIWKKDLRSTGIFFLHPTAL